ncbi:pentapeptide repeat-containing protein [Arenicellales bacterium nBUS_45]
MNKIIPLILSTLLLTSCSGPDSSGGVVFSKTDNAFPYGDCRGSGYQTHHTEKTGCGWFTGHNKKQYYIEPRAHLRYANLSDANLNHADLTGANLNHADLTYANLNWANLTGADLSIAGLRRADLSDANLSHADLTGVNLSDANLNHADLSYTNVNWANLTGADLSGVQVNSSTICPNGKPWGVGLNVSCQAAGLPQGPTSRIPVLCD